MPAGTQGVRWALRPRPVETIVHAEPTSRRWIAGAMVVVVTAFAGLTLATLWRLPPYFDESFYALQGYAVTVDPTALFAALPDGKGPVLNWLTAIVILFGASPLVAVRLVAAGASVGTALLVYCLGRRAADAPTAVAAMAIYAFLPFVVVQSSMGFYEPLVGFFATAALVLELRLLEKPTWGCGLLLGAVLGVGLLTKPTAQVVIVLLPVSLLVFPFGLPGASRRFVRWMGMVAVALAVSGLLYAIMMTSPLYDSPPVSLQHIPIGVALADPGSCFQLNWPGYRIALATYLTAPLVMLLGLGLGYGLAKRPGMTVFLTAWAIGGLVASTLIAGKPLARYYLPWLAPLALFIADGLLLVVDVLRRTTWVPDRVRKPVLAGVLSVLFVPALAADLSFALHPETAVLPGFDDREFVADWTARTGLARLANRIVSRSGDGVIAFSPGSNPAWSILLDDPGQRRYQIVDVSDVRAKDARYIVESGVPLVASMPCIGRRKSGCDRVDPSRYRLIDSIERPRLGATVRLFERSE